MAGAASRYAKGLLDALEASGEIATVLPRLKALSSLPSDVEHQLGDAGIPQAVRGNAVKVALGNPATNSVLGRFSDLLQTRRRIPLLSQICREAVALYEARQGIVRGTVFSNTPLSGTQLETLARGLSTGKSRTELVFSHDDTIIGGFKVRLGDTVLDATANNQLNQARQALLSALKETE